MISTANLPFVELHVPTWAHIRRFAWRGNPAIVIPLRVVRFREAFDGMCRLHSRAWAILLNVQMGAIPLTRRCVPRTKKRSRSPVMCRSSNLHRQATRDIDLEACVQSHRLMPRTPLSRVLGCGSRQEICAPINLQPTKKTQDWPSSSGGECLDV